MLCYATLWQMHGGSPRQHALPPMDLTSQPSPDGGGGGGGGGGARTPAEPFQAYPFAEVKKPNRATSANSARRAGGRMELEDALSVARTQLVFAKEKVAALEAANEVLRAQAQAGAQVPRAVPITREKLEEARAMADSKLINEHEFAAIKARFLADAFGVDAGDVDRAGGQRPELA